MLKAGDSYHTPVLFEEVMNFLAIERGGIYFDGTLGGGGHTLGILKRGGRVIATDRDEEAIRHATERLKSEKVSGYTLVRSNFKDVEEVLSQNGIEKLDGALLDLGISSHQIDEPQRGFSYRYDGKLDMRMDERTQLTAEIVVNEYNEQELSKILYEYGEERFTRKIVDGIVKARKNKRIETTLELAELIKRNTPESYHRQGHPAKKTFQALRIEVNGELEELGETVERLCEKLKSGGRLAVITFHSLEDRIVKTAFKKLCTDCICDKSLPICVCGHKASAKAVVKMRASEQEKELNKRVNSATLRVIEKL